MSHSCPNWPNCRISVKPPPCIDPTKATIAYGRLAIPRLNRELQDMDLLTRRSAIKALCDYLHDPEHIYEAISGGIIGPLVKLLSDNDESIKVMATECFVIINQHNIGREAFIENHVYSAMKILFAIREIDVVRLYAHRSIELLVLYPFYAEILVKQNIIPSLIACLSREIEEIQIVILDSLCKCLEINPVDGLNSGGIEVLSNTLTHSNPNIRHKSVQAILLLAANDKGKIDVIRKGIVPKLIELLNDSNSEVQASAAGALAFICVKTEGRYACLEGFAIPSLLNCLSNSNSRVRVNALKTLGCISEAPEGRRILLISLEQIERLTQDENAGVRKHAKITADIIKWKPWYTAVECPEDPGTDLQLPLLKKILSKHAY